MGDRILLVEDELNLQHALKLNLELEGYFVHVCGTGTEAVKTFRDQKFDLVILDIMLPEMDGLMVCENIRLYDNHIPVLFLSAKNTAEDRINGLKKGADDYLTKPFSLDELLARVRARLRRSELVTQERPTVLRLADLELNLASHEVRRAGVMIKLSLREFELISYLLKYPGQVHSRQEILREVWGPTFVGDDNLLDVYVGYLRRKLESPGLPILIQTVRGVGFMAKQGPIKN